MGWYFVNDYTLMVDQEAGTYQLMFKNDIFGTTDPGVKGVKNVIYSGKCTVAFPFGYGLSYSDLSCSSLTMKEEGANLVFTVDVTNSSTRDARDAVLLYMQSPYTEYDRRNGVEKAAVELVGYTKLDVPAGQTVTATVTVDKTELRSYDANGARTYMIFTVQYGVLDRGRMTAYLETMQELMHQQHVQYEASREGVQLINEKYHDLKNLIGSIENVLPREELNRLSSSIERYDVQVHSGFEVLDVVLTEKMNLCLQRGIGITCSLGQTDFGFLDEMDLYTLFNNALTNAINAVSAMPEGQERYILLSASQENNIITIHVENPCRGHIRFVDGIPQTSGNPDWHGFGMKSMVRTAEKYGGALSASQENGCFQLDILLLNQTEPSK